MAIPTFTDKTDGVDDVVAADMNSIFAALAIVMPATPAADWANAESLTDNKTLVDADLPIQSLSPTAARDVFLPVLDNSNHAFWIINRSGTYALTVKNAAAATVGSVPVSGSGLFISDGANGWYHVTRTAAEILAQVPAASTTVAGIIEAAIASEINTGTDDGRAVTPDSLAGSIMGRKYMTIKVIDDATVLTTGDGKIIIPIPPDFSGMNLVDADAAVSTVSSSGLPTVSIERIRTGTGAGTVDMLSTSITIDASEKTSLTATSAPAINGANDDVLMNSDSQDQLSINVDVAGTGAKGLAVMLTFGLP